MQTSFLHKHDIPIVDVEDLVTQPYNKDYQYTRTFMSEIVSPNPLFCDQVTNFSINQAASNVFDELDKLADFAAVVSTGEVGELQDVLESLIVDDRLRKALLVLKKELINTQLQGKLSWDRRQQDRKCQREYYLMKQLKGLKKDLGIESDGKDKLIEKFKERATTLKIPEPVRKVFDGISKLAGLESAASEANVTRSYLEWLTQDVKDRILEFIAVGKLCGAVEGKIICLVGPSGVGETSIRKSISHALNRQFFRFSVGGLSDVAEIKGHRRTYIIQALERVGTENPLVLIDEVDKIGRGYNGDPVSVLLEILDPEQNNSFSDHYMDVLVDLSCVTSFVLVRSNNVDMIPAPLLDRMEVLEVSGYVSEEKAVIVDKYLGPQEADAVLEPSTVDELGEEAFPEPTPVPMSAANAKTVESQEPTSNEPPASTSISADSDQKRNPIPIIDSDYVGPPVYQKDRMYVSSLPPGVGTSLSYLGNGLGAVMPVEAMYTRQRRPPGHGLSWVKNHAFELGITSSNGEQFLNHRDIHVPSAGTAILSAFVSLFTKTKINPDIAMTREISLIRQVLPVGGLKEKILATHRAGIKMIIAPIPKGTCRKA
ncbi:P-loop containing nucleoside triphosphate hydrolase protein [Infundibulicybe gibba]|nr:P-loop containing nucleoside triphosphate hydrolase protein [Infundibulicybe gibba]